MKYKKSYLLAALCVAALFIFAENELFGQTTWERTTAGTYTFTPDPGVTNISIELWGGGGAGGAGNTAGANVRSGGGGGGGGYIKVSNIPVTPGTGYSITVGQGGASSANAGTQSNATFATIVISANPGSGGTSASGANNGAGGTGGSGGTYTGGTLVIMYNGGTGVLGVNGNGGGGGGSAGTGSNGNVGTNGTPPNGATAVTGGGPGGTGGTAAGSAPASGPGGGGGGGRGTNNAGGVGYDGKVIITWSTPTPPPAITSFNPTSACSGSGQSVTITGANFTGVSDVSFNGVAASYNVDNATQITATLPAGATTGPISVTTSGGTATSPSDFTVNPLPTLAHAALLSPACANGSPDKATIGLFGVEINSTFTVEYTINSNVETPITGITADAYGGATFQTRSLTSGDHGKILTITKIINTSSTPNCEQSFSSNDTLSIEQVPVAGSLVKHPDALSVCDGTNVSATLTPGSGGNGVDELEYRFDPGTGFTLWMPFFPEGILTTTDRIAVEIRTRRLANGCAPSAYHTVSWSVNLLPTFTTGPGNTNITCFSGSDGTIQVTVTSADNSPYTFSVDSGVHYSTPFSGTYPNYLLTGLPAGTHKIRIKDKNGCESAVCP